MADLAQRVPARVCQGRLMQLEMAGHSLLVLQQAVCCLIPTHPLALPGFLKATRTQILDPMVITSGIPDGAMPGAAHPCMLTIVLCELLVCMDLAIVDPLCVLLLESLLALGSCRERGDEEKSAILEGILAFLAPLTTAKVHQCNGMGTHVNASEMAANGSGKWREVITGAIAHSGKWQWQMAGNGKRQWQVASGRRSSLVHKHRVASPVHLHAVESGKWQWQMASGHRWCIKHGAASLVHLHMAENGKWQWQMADGRDQYDSMEWQTMASESAWNGVAEYGKWKDGSGCRQKAGSTWQFAVQYSKVSGHRWCNGMGQQV
ncbi:hypothetical protein EI94DRAFT_1702541 [Lactarius quietus]|nr:hypothetical protein EI94DRAFT_1702541 [Lactarius quietus]